MPQTSFTPTAPPLNLFERLQELRATEQPAPLLSQPATVEGRRNQHWREVAEYEKWAFPLFLYLEGKNWQRVISQHEERWQWEFLQGLRYRMREHHGRYVGRKIRRNHILPGTTYRVKLTLPIPTPADYAHRKLNEGRNLYNRVLTERTTRNQQEATDPRQFLADELKWAAVSLSRYEQSRGSSEKKWHPGWELEQIFDPEAKRSRGVLFPSELGKVLALVERFWQCWQAFHEAEKKSGAASAYELSIEPSPPTSTALTHLHQAVQQAIGSRFADGYYSDALHKACTALEKAVQDKANQPPEPTGATMMSKVFSKDKPLLAVSSNQGEQEGYMFLYRGLAQAIRNHYAHNDPATDPARALEWLTFISALFYKLDEAQVTAV